MPLSNCFFLLYHSTLGPGDSIVVYTDSQYVLDLLNGSSFPSTHPQLVNLAQQYETALRVQCSVLLKKVPGHKGYPGNEMADLLAKRGVSRTGTLGRFSSSSSLPLRAPEIGYNQATWSSQTVQQQDDYNKSLQRQHTHLIPEIPFSAKKPWISDTTLSLITNFQAQPFEDLSQLKAARKAIKKSARRGKRLPW